MSRRWPWSGRPAIPPTPDGVDPELWEIFQAERGAEGPQLLESAQQIQRQIQAQPPAAATPAFPGTTAGELDGGGSLQQQAGATGDRAGRRAARRRLYPR